MLPAKLQFKQLQVMWYSVINSIIHHRWSRKCYCLLPKYLYLTGTWLKKYLMYLMSSEYSEYLYLYLYLQIWKSTCTWLKYFEKYLTPTLVHNIIMYNSTWNYLIIVYIYYYHTYIMQISIYVINDMPGPGRNLAADACMGRTQLSPCIISIPGHSVPTGMPCQHDIIFMLSHLYPNFLRKYT